MRGSLTVVVSFAVLAGAAVADERRAGGVRTTATVEVIDDARQVDDIISRVRSQKTAPPVDKKDGAPGKTTTPAPPRAVDRGERPALPPVVTPAPAPPRDRAADERRHERHLDHHRR